MYAFRMFISNARSTSNKRKRKNTPVPTNCNWFLPKSPRKYYVYNLEWYRSFKNA